MQFKTVLFTLATCLSLSGVQAKDSCSFSTTITAASAVSELNSCPTLDGKIEITGAWVRRLLASHVLFGAPATVKWREGSWVNWEGGFGCEF